MASLPLCGQCETEDATLQCIQCGEDLCTACSSFLHRRGKLKEHDVVFMDQERDEESQWKMSRPCENHEGEYKTLFCSECSEIVCALCLVSGGCQGHRCQPLKIAHAEAQVALTRNKEELQKRVGSIHSANSSVQEEIDAVKIEAKQLIKSVKKKFRHLNDLLDDREESVHEVVDEMASERKRGLDLQVARIQLSMEELITVKAKAEAILAIEEVEPFFEKYHEYTTGVEGAFKNTESVVMDPPADLDFKLYLDVEKHLTSIKEVNFARGGKRKVSGFFARVRRSIGSKEAEEDEAYLDDEEIPWDDEEDEPTVITIDKVKEPEFMVDETLDSLESIEKYSCDSSGKVPMQVRLAFINRIRCLAEEDSRHGRLITVIQTLMADKSPDIRASLVKSLSEVPAAAARAAMERPDDPQWSVEELRDAVFTPLLSLSADPHEDVAGQANRSFADAAQFIPPMYFQKFALGPVLEATENEDAIKRASAARILVELMRVPASRGTILAEQIVPKLETLSGDPDVNTRRNVAMAFSNLPPSEEPSPLQPVLLPLFLNMSTDSDYETRAICASSIGYVANALIPIGGDTPTAHRYQFQTGIIKQFLGDENKAVIRSAKLYFAHYVGELDPAQLKEDILELYVELFTKQDDAKVAATASYNFPAVLLRAGADKWKENLEVAFDAVVSHSSIGVRKPIVAAFHHIVKVVNEFVTDDWLMMCLDRFLGDDEEVIQNFILRNLPLFIEKLSKGNRDPYMRHYLNMKEHTTWRRKELFCLHAPEMIQLFPETSRSDILRSMLNCLESDVAAVRMAAASGLSNTLSVLMQSTLPVCVRDKSQEEVTDEMSFEKVVGSIQKFARSKHYTMRQVFVECCRHSIGILPQDAFNDWFLHLLLDLANDKVANVRIAVARVFSCDPCESILERAPSSLNRKEDELAAKKAAAVQTTVERPDVAMALEALAEDSDREVRLISSQINEKRRTSSVSSMSSTANRESTSSASACDKTTPESITASKAE